MAIAAMLDLEETAAESEAADLFDAPWPRPALRVVPGPETDELGAEDRPEARLLRLGAQAVLACSPPPAVVRTGVDVSERRAVRAAIQRRRRRLVIGTVVAGLSVGLALPLAAFGGAPAATPRVAADAVVAGATVYVVQPGDTVWSIATQFDRSGDPRSLAEAIARETGSNEVVPGERISIP